jgi:ammonia channel protein AmtB
MNATFAPPLNVSYFLPTDVSGADTAFYILGAAMVFIMTPGLGLFYAGMARRKNSLTLLMLCFLAMTVVTLQWFIWGFSLAYSQYGTTFIGSWDYFGFSGVNIYSVFLTNPAVSSIGEFEQKKSSFFFFFFLYTFLFW